MADAVPVIQQLDEGGQMVQERFAAFLTNFTSVVEGSEDTQSQHNYRCYCCYELYTLCYAAFIDCSCRSAMEM
jgi:hypothetical protein